MRKTASDFIKICDILEKNYAINDGNKFFYTKKYLEKHIGHDHDALKSFHAEATESKIGEKYGMYINFYAVIIATVTLVITIISTINPSNNGEPDASIMLICLGYMIFLVVIAFLFNWGMERSKSVSHWQKYMIEAIEDILSDMNKEELMNMENKEVVFPERFYEKLNLLDTQLNILIQLCEERNSVKKVESKRLFHNIRRKKSN